MQKILINLNESIESQKNYQRIEEDVRSNFRAIHFMDFFNEKNFEEIYKRYEFILNKLKNKKIDKVYFHYFLDDFNFNFIDLRFEKLKSTLKNMNRFSKDEKIEYIGSVSGIKNLEENKLELLYDCLATGKGKFSRDIEEVFQENKVSHLSELVPTLLERGAILKEKDVLFISEDLSSHCRESIEKISEYFLKKNIETYEVKIIDSKLEESNDRYWNSWFA